MMSTEAVRNFEGYEYRLNAVFDIPIASSNAM